MTANVLLFKGVEPADPQGLGSNSTSRVVSLGTTHGDSIELALPSDMPETLNDNIYRQKVFNEMRKTIETNIKC